MSRLKVVLRGTVVSEIELAPEKEYVGGRKEGCDIRLQPEKGISREHFKLKFTDGKWQIIAISRFGDVFSLGQKIEQADLQHNQTFHVPPYDFTFLDLAEAGVSAQDRPRIPLEVSENTKTILGAAPQMPYIKIVNSKGEVREMLRLEVGEVWVAGRDPVCQIIIPDQRVSRRQFEIHKVNGAYTIIDLASVNGTFLNGTPVSSTDPQTLKSGDSISVLGNVLYFELHDPNFKYKVENIEIPPLQIDSEPPPPRQAYAAEAQEPLGEVPELSEQDDEFVEDSQIAEESMEQIEESDLPAQLQTGDGPFTGMPNQGGYENNQYYSFDQQAPPQPGSSTQAPPPPILPQKNFFEKNRPLLIALVVAILGGAYYFSENMGVEEGPVQAIVNESDPFYKLTPEQQKAVEENYTIAEQMYNQQKYDLALKKIRDIKELLPNGYKDSERIELEAEQANLTIVQQQKDEEARKEREEREAKMKQTLAECLKLIGPDITAAVMGECLAPVVAIDPNEPEYLRLMSEAEKIEQEKERKAIEAQNYAKQVAELKEIFADAEAVQTDGFAFKAIRAYEKVIKSNLPDPDQLKDKATKRVAFIQEKVRRKSETSLTSADLLYKEGKLKEAIVTLRDAVVYDPNNQSIQDKMDSFTYELTKQVRTIYQEAIIDENYGLIDNTETKVGAKDKWKKITEMDLEDGEYYRKAIVKLRRYGVF